MAVRDLLCGLAHTGGQALHSLSAAATEVLRHAELQESEETDLKLFARETQEFFDSSPLGDGNHMHAPDGVERASR